MQQESHSNIDPKTVINQETAKIPWHDLQRFFASGTTLHVHHGLDLVDVALAMHEDDKTAIQRWMSDGLLGGVSDDDARNWYEQHATVWAVVIAPWILVQPVTGGSVDE
ncbi:DUF2288 domain-containing protein [Kistimonas asteriae]|uniref:DUF2288 domain-containing protein n=1 Tax=Kistimonas asteriae TaxID=517724 RepID=UPI001BA48DCB|nr:DUF2288 domain-containing protein [Kistimonas asteriae]